MSYRGDKDKGRATHEPSDSSGNYHDVANSQAGYGGGLPPFAALEVGLPREQTRVEDPVWGHVPGYNMMAVPQTAPSYSDNLLERPGQERYPNIQFGTQSASTTMSSRYRNLGPLSLDSSSPYPPVQPGPDDNPVLQPGARDAAYLPPTPAVQPPANLGYSVYGQLPTAGGSNYGTQNPMVAADEHDNDDVPDAPGPPLVGAREAWQVYRYNRTLGSLRCKCCKKVYDAIYFENNETNNSLGDTCKYCRSNGSNRPRPEASWAICGAGREHTNRGGCGAYLPKEIFTEVTPNGVHRYNICHECRPHGTPRGALYRPPPGGLEPVEYIYESWCSWCKKMLDIDNFDLYDCDKILDVDSHQVYNCERQRAPLPMCKAHDDGNPEEKAMIATRRCKGCQRLWHDGQFRAIRRAGNILQCWDCRNKKRSRKG